jgi:hypothetical protein
MAELREAKQKKEQMLRNSIRDFKVLMDQEEQQLQGDQAVEAQG